MSLDLFPADTRARVERLEAADIVVSVPGCGTVDGVRTAAEAVRAFAGGSRRVLLVHPDAIDDAQVIEGRPLDTGLQLLPCPLAGIGRLPFPADDARLLFQQLSAIGDQVHATAHALIGALPQSITPAKLRAAVEPVADWQFDLVLPCYARHKLDGLINSGIVYPLARALYGQRIDGQLGIDFGFSRRFISGVFSAEVRRMQSASIWLLSEAVERGYQTCQGYMGAFLPPFDPSQDLSAALAAVLGSLFDDMDRHASLWQRVRGSQPVRTFGDPTGPPDEDRPIDAGAMIESFQIGFRNLQEVWGRVLPPATLIELSRLARLPAERFRLADELWVRIVFDFALGHRLRVISRDHLLRAMTPLYLAWAASYVLEVGHASDEAARDRLERLSLAYESGKPYLLARWRWPDRFNP
jgi:glucosylglycerate synthase